MAKTVIGLDIGSTHVTAAELAFSAKAHVEFGAGTLVRVMTVPLASGIAGDGDVFDLRALASALKVLWSRGGFSQKRVVLGVGNQRTVAREMSLPEMSIDDIRRSLPFQVEDQMPMPVSEALLDFFPTGTVDGASGPLVRGMMVAAPSQSISNMVRAVELAGLRPICVDLTAFALHRALVHGDVMNQTIALVDVGARSTTIVVSAKGQPRLVRTLPSGGQDATDAVSSAMSVPVGDAEAIKREVGVGVAVRKERTAAAEAVAQATRALVEAVRNTFVYYSGDNPGGAIQHVLLTGGGGQLMGFGQYLASASRLPVTFGDGLSRVRTSKGAKVGPGDGPFLATAVGLALAEEPS